MWFCLFCFLAKRISLAIGVIKEAGRSIAAMPLIAVWPVLQLVRLFFFPTAMGMRGVYSCPCMGGGRVGEVMPLVRYGGVF